MLWAWLGRIAISLLMFRARRRRSPGTSGPTPSTVPIRSLRSSLGRLGEGLDLVWQVVVSAALFGAGALATLVAISLLLLGPRWLGAVAGLVALVALAGGAVGANRVRRDLQARRRRHRLQIADDEVS